MSHIIGIRREDKNKWEKRVPLTPDDLKELKDDYDIQAFIQPSDIRAFTAEEYKKSGAVFQEDLSDASIVFGVKEIPSHFFQKNKTYVFFSHTIKGQGYNMPMLHRMMELGCNLIDYEKIADEKNRRLVFFGRFAGFAGMVDSLWALGKRLNWKGVKNPFSEIQKTIEYNSLEEIKDHLKRIGKKIEQEGFPEIITPVVVGFAGYGNVSQGAQEILDFLPVKEIRPNQIEAIHDNYSNKLIYKVVFREEDIVEPVFSEAVFNLQEYYNSPHIYRSVFEQYIRKLSVLMNCIYWDERYPRLITKEFLEENFTGEMKLQVVGDISVDINGAIEFTEKTTNPDAPVYVYNPIREDIIEGYVGSGVAVVAVDNLPCELPKDSSEAFSKNLLPFVPDVAKADYTVPFNMLKLPPEVKKAVILYHGKLTPEYEYINKFL